MITLDGEHFFIDLMFYNRLTRSFVLLDLKVCKLTHQDLGQMQMYVNYYQRNRQEPSQYDQAARDPLRHRLAGMVPVSRVENRLIFRVQTQGVLKSPGFRAIGKTSDFSGGEPFEALVKERRYLPNPVTRFCTTTLKIRVMRDYARSIGWEHWTNAIGLRADEDRRVAKLKDQRERWESVAPLHSAGVSKEDVATFWATQPFDLRLANIDGKTPAGNCDLCFLKSVKTIASLIRTDPSLADWWIRMEAEARPSKPLGAVFRKDRPGYRRMRQAAMGRCDMDFGERDALAACFCHD